MLGRTKPSRVDDRPCEGHKRTVGQSRRIERKQYGTAGVNYISTHPYCLDPNCTNDQRKG